MQSIHHHNVGFGVCLPSLEEQGSRWRSGSSEVAVAMAVAVVSTVAYRLGGTPNRWTAVENEARVTATVAPTNVAGQLPLPLPIGPVTPPTT